MIDDRFLPEYDVRSRHEALVRAPVERVWETLRSADLNASMLVRVLFALRGLPTRGSLTLGDAGRIGFVTLAERAPDTLLLGLIGQFWRLDGGICVFPPEGFAAFDEAGFAKATWSFTLSAVAAGTLLSTETRVRCTDARSRRRFRRYWRWVGPFSGLIRREILRIVVRAC